MTEWFDALSGLQQTLFAIALFSTLVFAIQVVFTLFGIGEVGETEFGDLFTIRNGVSFLMGFSWGGLMAYDWGLRHIFFVMVVGLALGALFVAINMGFFALMSLLKHEGNVRIKNSIGRLGIVSLAVPASRTGVGKVSVSVQDRLLEFHAVTDGGAIPRHTSITVLGLAGSQLIVGRAEGATRAQSHNIAEQSSPQDP